MKLLALFLCAACSAPPITRTLDAADAATIAEHAQCAQSCAACCETQPYINETKDGTKFAEPIHACNSDPPEDWSVEWCRTDCEAVCP